MNRFGILSTWTRPARTWCRHAIVRLQRQWFDSIIRRRIARKINSGEPVRVVFVIHEPRSYSALASIIDEMKRNSRFEVMILAVHYRHGVFSDNGYHDGGAADYLRNHRIHFNSGTDGNGNFTDLKTLNPDLVFFQTPYNQYLFPPLYDPKEVARYAFLAYVPYYGISLSDGLKPITHSPYFFQYIRYAFMGTEFDCSDLKHRVFWCNGYLKVYNSGCPKLEYVLSTKYDPSKSAWRTSGEEVYRVLWTPRWNPDEGTSHFLPCWKVLLNWARENAERVEFVLRPHPLMFSHLLKTKRLTESELSHIRAEFARIINTHIDESDDYQHTLLGADCLVADPATSMATEFFVQDKPVIYTDSGEEIDSQLQKMLTPGYYVAHDEAEMIKHLDFLLKGEERLEIKNYRKGMVDRLMAPLKERSCGGRAVDTIISDVLSK